MTPGAGTARPVRGIARGGVCDVSGQLRRCVGYPGDTSVAPTFWRRHSAALRRSFGRHKCRPYVLAAVSCGVATVFRATQVSPLRLAAASCDVASVIRATQVSPLRLAAAFRGVATVVRAVMDVGAPFMTPGAGTARPVRGIVRGSVRDDAGQLRRCVGCSGDTSVAPTFWRRHPAALRRSFGRHKCRPYVLAAASCGVASVFQATQVSPLRFGGGILRRCDGYPGDTSVAPTFWRRHPAALRRFSGRHKCRPYVWRRVWRSRCLPTR